MAHFAELDNNNNVLRVIVVANEELIDSNGIESEYKGILFCKSLFGQETNWIQTSYNGSFRKNFAGIGFTWDKNLDAFIPQKPFNSWILNKDTCLWDAPVSKPQDDNFYNWDEATLSWVQIKL